MNFMHSLDFSNQNLTTLPDLSDVPDDYTELDCSYNQLTELTNLPKSLKYLESTDNQISYIDSFPENLIVINLKNNNLRTLPKLPPKLQRLNVNYNQLVELPILPDTLRELQCGLNYDLKELPILPYNLVLFVYGRKTSIEIKLDQYNDRLRELGRPKVTELPDYNTWKSVMRRKGQADRIDDLAIAFRGSGLPPYIVTQIIKEDVQVPAWNLYEIEQHVRPILYRDETTDVDYENNRVDLTTGKLKPISLPQ